MDDVQLRPAVARELIATSAILEAAAWPDASRDHIGHRHCDARPLRRPLRRATAGFGTGYHRMRAGTDLEVVACANAADFNSDKGRFLLYRLLHAAPWPAKVVVDGAHDATTRAIANLDELLEKLND